MFIDVCGVRFESMWLARPTKIRGDGRALKRIRKWYMYVAFEGNSRV
jgi:hypothetical protein